MDNRWAILFAALAVCVGCRGESDSRLPKSLLMGPTNSVRIATFNASLSRNSAGELQGALTLRTSHQARQVAEIIQRVRPDILLINELDGNDDGQAARLFLKNYLEIGQNGQPGLEYPFVFVAAVNTGVPSGRDLDDDGTTDGPADCFGFGRFPGQFGMTVYSRYPIDEAGVRTFRDFLWKDMPGALQPRRPENAGPYYSSATWKVLRLSSKSHWDIPIQIGQSRLHFLVAHPTPPVFDGREDRNGARNHDEIRFWADYVSGERAHYIYDDAGRQGALSAGEFFVIAGDLNADPHDGDSRAGAVAQLLDHPRINGSIRPSSQGAVQASSKQGNVNLSHRGAAELDTADFADDNSGNLRVDYVLPCRELTVVDAGVYWPPTGEEGHDLVTVSDHRLVWIDVRL